MPFTHPPSPTPGFNHQPKIQLIAADGARADIYLQGAQVTSWIPPDGRERLYLSRTADFQPGRAVRGGVPIIFPQFSGLGPLLKHGFARLSAWTCTRMDSSPSGATAVFRLQDNAATRAQWPHAFLAEYMVTIGGTRLEMDLEVNNPGPGSIQFTAALHTYLRVDDLQTVTIDGLSGLPFLDHGTGRDQLPGEPGLVLMGEVDRLYRAVPGPVVVREPRQRMEITASGFPDVVLWNPGLERAAQLRDLEPEGYQHMVCVEAAAVGTPVDVPEGGRWHGRQTLSTLAPG